MSADKSTTLVRGDALRDRRRRSRGYEIHLGRSEGARLRAAVL